MTDTVVACDSCGHLLHPSDEACPNCGVLAGTVSNLDPMQAIESEGRLLTKATEGKPKTIVLIGIWILFAPVFFASAYMAIDIAVERPGTTMTNFIFFWGAVGLAIISGKILYKVTRNYLGTSPGK